MGDHSTAFFGPVEENNENVVEEENRSLKTNR